MKPIDRGRWEALRPLLDAALELDPEARAAWLERKRAERPDLAAEIEALLDQDVLAEQEGFLSPDRTPTRPDVASSLAGQVLGPWRLERPLGQGGMGTVWLARREDGRFEGVAAIKFLSLLVVFVIVALTWDNVRWYLAPEAGPREPLAMMFIGVLLALSLIVLESFVAMANQWPASRLGQQSNPAACSGCPSQKCYRHLTLASLSGFGAEEA